MLTNIFMCICIHVIIYYTYSNYYRGALLFPFLNLFFVISLRMAFVFRYNYSSASGNVKWCLFYFFFIIKLILNNDFSGGAVMLQQLFLITSRGRWGAAIIRNGICSLFRGLNASCLSTLGHSGSRMLRCSVMREILMLNDLWRLSPHDPSHFLRYAFSFCPFLPYAWSYTCLHVFHLGVYVRFPTILRHPVFCLFCARSLPNIDILPNIGFLAIYFWCHYFSGGMVLALTVLFVSWLLGGYGARTRGNYKYLKLNKYFLSFPTDYGRCRPQQATMPAKPMLVAHSANASTPVWVKCRVTDAVFVTMLQLSASEMPTEVDVVCTHARTIFPVRFEGNHNSWTHHESNAWTLPKSNADTVDAAFGQCLNS